MTTIRWILAGATAFFIPFCMLYYLHANSRWGALRAQYAAHGPPRGVSFRQEARVQDVWFRGTLTIFATVEGLYFRPWVFERWLLKPLYIPWSATHDPAPARRWLCDYVRFDVGYPPIAAIELRRQLFLLCAPEHLTMLWR
jgi:hypothetical protein